MSEVRVNNLTNENNTGGPTISGITTYSGRHFFVPPQGTTAQRPEDCEPGSLRFNTDTAHLEYFRGNTIGWTEIEAELTEPLGTSATGIGHRGIVVGGGAPGGNTHMDFYNHSTFGSSTDFGDYYQAERNSGFGQAGSSTRMLILCGDLTPQGGSIHGNIASVTIASTGYSADSGNDMTVARRLNAQFSNSTRACAAGGYEPNTNVIDFTTISSLSAGQDFGDLNTTGGSNSQGYFLMGSSSSTRGVLLKGYNSAGTAKDAINFVTISTTGDAVEFGDAQAEGQSLGAANNSTRIVFAEGGAPSVVNTISFITTATTGNAIDFGDLVGTNRRDGAGTSSPTRGIFSCGYDTSNHHDEQDAVELATTGNSVNFGDTVNGNRFRLSGGSSGHGGL